MKKIETLIVPVEKIQYSEYNPRENFDGEALAALGNNIDHHGQIESLLAERIYQPENGCEFRLAKGARRLRSIIESKIPMAEITVVEFENTLERFKIQLSDLFQVALNCVEVSHAIKTAKEKFACSMCDLKTIFGHDEDWIRDHDSLNSFSRKVLDLMGPNTPKDKRIPFSTGLLLRGMPEDEQIKLAQIISGHQLSAKEAKRLIVGINAERDAKMANIPGLGMKGDFKMLRSIFTRMDGYLEKLLSVDNKEFQRIIEGQGIDKVIQLKVTARQISDKCKELEEVIQKVRDSMISRDLGVEQSNDLNKGVSRPNGNVHRGGKIEFMHTVTLLRMIGTPKKMLRTPRGMNGQTKGASLWYRKVNHLAILEQAKKMFRARIQVSHPDRPEGNAEDAQMLNRIWETIEQRFGSHGFSLGK